MALLAVAEPLLSDAHPTPSRPRGYRLAAAAAGLLAAGALLVVGVRRVEVVAGVTSASPAVVFGESGADPADVARNPVRLFNIIGVHTQTESDIDQGYLGDCYFDATLASIAYHQPAIIDAMFVQRNLWSKNVFTSRWLIGGEEHLVAVNDMIPTNSGGQPVFMWNRNHLWPVILEKAWAKIFGNYKAIENGWPFNVMKAIMQCPVQSISHSEGDDMIWKAITDGNARRYVMASATRPPEKRKMTTGIAKSHAYAIFGTSEDYKGHGKAVQMYNPWGHNKYIGLIKGQDQSTGAFWVTFAEFLDSFWHSSIGKYDKGKSFKSIRVPLSDGAAEIAREVSFPSGSCEQGCSSVSITWPQSRMLGGCRLSHTFTLALGPKNTPGRYNVVQADNYGDQGADLDVFAGAGSYYVYFKGDFPAWLDHVTLDFYTKGSVTDGGADHDPSATYQKMTAGCVDTAKSCTYWKGLGYCDAGNKFHSFMLGHCKKTCDKCLASKLPADCVDKNKYCDFWEGKGYCSTPRFRSYMSRTCPRGCGTCTFVERLAEADLSHPEVPPEVDIPEPTYDLPAAPEHNASLPSIEASPGATVLEDDKCAELINRLGKLDNSAEIMNGDDSLFPESLQSIAAPGVYCGDSAQGLHGSCAKFNHWKSFRALAKCKDLKSASSCQYWKRMGYCEHHSKFYSFMNINCALTCGFCAP